MDYEENSIVPEEEPVDDATYSIRPEFDISEIDGIDVSWIEGEDGIEADVPESNEEPEPIFEEPAIFDITLYDLAKVVSRTATAGNYGTYTLQPISSDDGADLGGTVLGVYVKDDGTELAAGTVVGAIFTDTENNKWAFVTPDLTLSDNTPSAVGAAGAAGTSEEVSRSDHVHSGFVNPMTTSQDIIVGGVAGAAGRLGVGSEGQALIVSGGNVAWGTAAVNEIQNSIHLYRVFASGAAVSGWTTLYSTHADGDYAVAEDFEAFREGHMLDARIKFFGCSGATGAKSAFGGSGLLIDVRLLNITQGLSYTIAEDLVVQYPTPRAEETVTIASGTMPAEDGDLISIEVQAASGTLDDLRLWADLDVLLKTGTSTGVTLKVGA